MKMKMKMESKHYRVDFHFGVELFKSFVLNEEYKMIWRIKCNPIFMIYFFSLHFIGFSFSVDIDTAETTTLLPAISDMAALGNSSNRSDIHRLRFSLITLNLPILLIFLINSLRFLCEP